MKNVSKAIFFFLLLTAGIHACKEEEPDPVPELTLTAIAPEAGPVGTAVTISGKGFSEVTADNSLTFDGKKAEVTQASSTSLTAVVPEGATTGEVQVIVNSRVATGPVFTVEAEAPTISGITPESGYIGDEVTISGANFSEVTAENAVSFNGQEAEVTEASATSLKVLVPEDATTGEVEVTVNGKTATGPIFTVEQPEPIISGFAPESGKVGQEVTISGENFSEVASENRVTFNGKEAEVLTATETELTVKVPSRAGSGPVAVSVGETTAEGEAFEYILTVSVSTVAGSGVRGFKEGAGEEAEFNWPTGLSIDEAGNMYVVDLSNHAIRKIDAQGMVTTLAGNGSAGYSDGTGDQAQFDSPNHLVLGAGGDLFVADFFNHMIRRVSTAGSVSTFAGSGGAGDTDGTGTAAEFNRPAGVATDVSGNLYVGDLYNHLIRKISPQGVVTTLAGSGNRGYADGPGAGAQFSAPRGLAVDEEGNVYVADASNHRIRKVSPAGEVSTVAGNGSAGTANGQGTAAQFYSPYDIAFDNRGYLFVADFRNHLIRMISPSGQVTTLAGTGASGYVDGEGSQAQFDYPGGLAVDQEGNVYVADGSNHRIRKITIE